MVCSPCARFDYPAAGNSLDGDLNETGLHWAGWQRSVDGAIDWLRGVSGARRVVLLGFATGGALATLVAAARRDVAALMLFEPVIVGRSHIRQLILEGDLQRGASMPRELGLEIRENRFGSLTVAQIGELDLREVVLPAECDRSAAVAAFVPEEVGTIGANAAVIAALPFMLVGLAVLHSVSQRWPARGLALGLVYVTTVILGWPAIVVAALGIVDQWLPLRGPRTA